MVWGDWVFVFACVEGGVLVRLLLEAVAQHGLMLCVQHELGWLLSAVALTPLTNPCCVYASSAFPPPPPPHTTGC